MYYLVNTTKQTVLFRSKNKSRLQEKLAKMRMFGHGSTWHLKIQDTKPVSEDSIKRRKLYVSVLEYNDPIEDIM